MYFVYNSMATYLSKHSFVCFNNFKPLCIWSVSKNIYDGLLISSWMKKMQVLNYMKKININHFHFWITFSLIEYSHQSTLPWQKKLDQRKTSHKLIILTQVPHISVNRTAVTHRILSLLSLTPQHHSPHWNSPQASQKDPPVKEIKSGVNRNFRFIVLSSTFITSRHYPSLKLPT